MRVDEGRDESTLTLPLEVFTTPGCPYCARAKRFFKRHSLPYTERDVSANEAVLREMIERAGGATCPQIFVAGKLVGGYDTMLAEYEAGRLEPRLARAGLQMVEAPEEAQPEAAEQEVAADERSAALRAESTLNPNMGGGGAVDAAGTAAALQRCMLLRTRP